MVSSEENAREIYIRDPDSIDVKVFFLFVCKSCTTIIPVSASSAQAKYLERIWYHNIYFFFENKKNLLEGEIAMAVMEHVPGYGYKND